MLRQLIDEMVQARGMNPLPYKILYDVDGTGIGNAAWAEREERPKEGGIFVYLWGYKYPYRGNPEGETVKRLATFKKNLRLMAESVRSWQTKVLIGLVLLMPKFMAGFLLKDVVGYLHYSFHNSLREQLLKPIRYCRCVRELYRTFDVLITKEKNKTIKKLLEFARDLICMSIEMDSAYRFRWQDAISGMKEKIDIVKFFDVLIEREVENDMKDRWRHLKKTICPAFKIGLIKSIFNDFNKEVNLAELMPDEIDDYYNSMRQDYEFRGKLLPERIEARKILEGDNWKYFEPVATDFLREYAIRKKVNSIK